MSKNLSQVFRPIDHQRMIDYLSKQFQTEQVLSRILWHTEQYIAKTGNLPK